MDAWIKRMCQNRDCGYIDLKRAVWEMDKAQIKNWSQTITANGASSYALNTPRIEFPLVTVDGVLYNNCYIQVTAGYLITPGVLANNDNAWYGTDTDSNAKLVFIGTLPATGTIVIKALTTIWAEDYTHPYGTSQGSTAYSEAISKAINNGMAVNQSNICKYETEYITVNQGQQLSFFNYSGSTKGRIEIVVTDNNGNLVESSLVIKSDGTAIGVSVFQITDTNVIIQVGSGGIGYTLNGTGVATTVLNGKVKIKFI
jgi:hypothetical protein